MGLGQGPAPAGSSNVEAGTGARGAGAEWHVGPTQAHVGLGRMRGWGAREVRAHEGLAARGGPASTRGTRGVIVWHAARPVPAAGPGDWCGPTLQRSWSQCSSPGSQVSAGIPPSGPSSPGWPSPSAQRGKSAVSSHGLG